MILIAPDKFKGTLSAEEVTAIIASETPGASFLAPMADGGEGTARILCRGEEWEQLGRHYFNRATGEAVVDSSAYLGLHLVDKCAHDILRASSAPLGVAVKKILDDGATKVTIAIGGTSCCDGGEGFLHAIGHWVSHPEKFMGLSDVAVPLLEALMFAPQKGATPEQLPLLEQRLRDTEKRFGKAHSPYDGAGGGLGYAIASVIGAECRLGAEQVLESYDIPWEHIDAIVTGEGRIDSQTSTGKVVEILRRKALGLNIPLTAIGGTVAQDYMPLQGITKVVATDKYFPHLPLTKLTARLRLRHAYAGEVVKGDASVNNLHSLE